MSLSVRKRQYLKTMGIQLWDARRQLPGEKTLTAALADNKETETLSVSENSPVALRDVVINKDPLEWKRLQQEVAQCTACDLHQTRTNTVFGIGDTTTKLMIIGEAPGQEEDKQGQPFVGRAGQLLTQMLHAIGFARETVFIANILKCRPPNNRDPRVEEVIHCADFLKRQIQWIQPKVILSVGRISAHNLLQKTETIGKLRGKVHQHPEFNIPVIVTYHPAYLLRSPQEKIKSWNDLVLVKRILQDSV